MCVGEIFISFNCLVLYVGFKNNLLYIFYRLTPKDGLQAVFVLIAKIQLTKVMTTIVSNIVVYQLILTCQHRAFLALSSEPCLSPHKLSVGPITM